MKIVSYTGPITIIEIHADTTHVNLDATDYTLLNSHPAYMALLTVILGSGGSQRPIRIDVDTDTNQIQSIQYSFV